MIKLIALILSYMKDLVRRELLDKALCWNANDLTNKLNLFQRYYNEERCHHGISQMTPLQKAE